MSNKKLDSLNKILNDFSKGNKEKSYKNLKKYIEKNPEDIVAKYNFGYMSQLFNEQNIAIKFYKEVVSKDLNHWQSRNNLYLIYLNNQRYLEALKLVDQVLNIKKNYQPAQRDKALILNYLNKPDEALNFIQNAIKQNSVDYIAINTLGLILVNLKKYMEAEKVFLEAIKINPQYVSSYNNLGHCYTLLNKREESLKYFLKAIKINPDSYESINNLANYYLENGSYEESLNYYFKAIKFNPNNSKIIYNIGNAYFHLGEDKKSEEYYKKSYLIDPGDERLQKNYSILLLKLQRYKEAWPLFDGRLKLKDFSKKNSNVDNIKEKLWKNENLLKNDKILVVKEQGIGDEILYGSMYPDLINNFPNVIIESDHRLISLFKRSFDSVNKNRFHNYLNFSGNKKKLEQFKTVIYAGSLGKLFRNKISDFPKKRFLKSNKKLQEKIKIDLDKLNNLKKVGISWKSKREHYGKYKSIDLPLLLPILKLKELFFINMQYGDCEKEIKEFNNKNKTNIHTFDDVDLFNDFEGAGALLKNLDLFITVSNSTAHLAGALGVPTWLIKPKNHATFHYWNQPKEVSPWYESIKIFSSNNSFEKVVSNIEKEIKIIFNI